MIFNKPIWAPNMILVDAPTSGLAKLDIALDVLGSLTMKDQVIGIFASDRIKNIEKEKIIIEQYDYSIYKKSNKNKSWLRSKFLNGRAKIVYYVISPEKEYRAAIVNVYDLISTEYPVICISEFLNKEINPAAMVVPTIEDKDFALQHKMPAAMDGKVYTINEFLSFKTSFEDQSFKLSK
jgi:hypothetical protein